MAKRRVTRRRFVKSAGAAAAAASAVPILSACGGDDDGGTPDSGGGNNELRILQWTHFVPGYDTWLDMIAEQWGEANGINVTIDRVPVGDLIPMADAEFEAGEGHDLIEFVSPPSARENDVLDLRDLNEELQDSIGSQIEFARQSSFNSKTGKWYGVNHGWTPLPCLFRRSMWDAVGMPDGPTTWDEVRTVGAMIKDSTDVFVGLGLSDELDSNHPRERSSGPLGALCRTRWATSPSTRPKRLPPWST